LFYVKEKTRIQKRKGDTMTTEKAIIETGWNLDNSYARLPKSFFTSLNPAPVRSPKLIILNYPLATSLGLNVQALQSKDGIAVLAGNRIPEGALPLAQAYAGHQFGHFTMLGDGRALLISEQITPLIFNSRVQAKRHIPAGAMVERHSGRCCANTS
jgi:serine/tyrosine/threonine adenylyltransferase